MISTIDFDVLLAPITTMQIDAGENIEFDTVVDQIKYARQADPVYLSQGDWKTTLKTADWLRVKNLAIEVLSTRSKDIQVTAYLIEALVYIHGLAGLRDGLTLLNQLLLNFWQTLYPQQDEEGYQIRASRIIWLNNSLTTALSQLPLTISTGSNKGYAWLHWQESRDVDNLARQNQLLYEQALSNGKINAERWDEAVQQTPATFYTTLLNEAQTAYQALDELIHSIDELFVDSSPSLLPVRETLSALIKLISKITFDRGLISQTNDQPEIAIEGQSNNHPQCVNQLNNFSQARPLNRDEALQHIRLLADFFRQHEPHSPIPYLLEKAVRWGNMRLDEWLQEVIQDDSTRYRFQDVLGYGANTES